MDQASIGPMKPSEQDVALSKRFPKLSPGQIALCRGHLESIAIQYIGWDDKELQEARCAKVAELNRTHGSGLAEPLWQEVIDHLESLFQGNEIRQNVGAWQSLIQ